MKGLSGVSLHLWIIPPSNQLSQPKCRYINIELYPGSLLGEGSFRASLLLENPQRKNYLTYNELVHEVIHVHVCTCIHVIHTCMYMYTCTYTYMHVHVYIYMYIYIHIFTYTPYYIHFL